MANDERKKRMKEVTVKVQGDLVVPQATLGEAGLSGRLRLIVQPGEIRILPEPTSEAESCKSWLAAWDTSQPRRTISTSSSAACMKLDEVPGGSIYVDTNILYMYLRADPTHLSILTTFSDGLSVARLRLLWVYPCWTNSFTGCCCTGERCHRSEPP